MKTFKPITGHLAENADKKKQQPTEGEKNFISFCERMSIPYEFQVPIYCDEKGYILDFELTYEYPSKKSVRKSKYVLEIDGEYHDLPEQRQKDTTRTIDLLNAGYKKVIRIKNEDTGDDYSLFNELYRQIPKEGKAGALYAAYLKEKYNRMVEKRQMPVIPIKKNQPSYKEILERAYNTMTIDKLHQEIEQLKKENETLKQVSMVLAEDTCKAEKERDYWKEKAIELDKKLWALSVSTGNYSYYPPTTN